jgi:hypothetical protein
MPKKQTKPTTTEPHAPGPWSISHSARERPAILDGEKCRIFETWPSLTTDGLAYPLTAELAKDARTLLDMTERLWKACVPECAWSDPLSKEFDEVRDMLRKHGRLP